MIKIDVRKTVPIIVEILGANKLKWNIKPYHDGGVIITPDYNKTGIIEFHIKNLSMEEAANILKLESFLLEGEKKIQDLPRHEVLTDTPRHKLVLEGRLAPDVYPNYYVSLYKTWRKEAYLHPEPFYFENFIAMDGHICVAGGPSREWHKYATSIAYVRELGMEYYYAQPDNFTIDNLPIQDFPYRAPVRALPMERIGALYIPSEYHETYRHPPFDTLLVEEGGIYVDSILARPGLVYNPKFIDQTYSLSPTIITIKKKRISPIVFRIGTYKTSKKEYTYTWIVIYPDGRIIYDTYW